MKRNTINNILNTKELLIMISSSSMDPLHQIRLLEISSLLSRITSANLIMELLLSTARLALEELEHSLVFGQWSTSKFPLRHSLDGLESPDLVQFLAHSNFTFLKWNQIIFTPTNQPKKVESWPKSWMRVLRTNTKHFTEKPIRLITWSEPKVATLKTNVNVNYSTIEQTTSVRLTHQCLHSKMEVLR